MKKTMIGVAFALIGLFVAATVTPALANGKVHNLVIHVDDNDAKKMNLALNNAENVTNYFESRGETVNIEIVAYGPGLMMMRSDKSPVKSRIEKMSLELDNIQFSACGVTRGKMAKKEGKEIPIMSEATMVPAGVVRIMELQDEGWNYIRP